VCDHYFCSVMGPTNPNRLYLWTGTNDPNGVAGGPVVDNATADFRWTTYPERLQAAGVNWKVYQNAHDNYDDNALAWFRQFREARPGSPLYERGMASVPARTADTCADIVAAIEGDVLAGTLPTVSWIIAPERCSEHPRHAPAAGAEFITRVLAALTADPSVWASTALLINYDENDGFFDHVPPPVPPPSTADEFIGGEPIGFGPRVPMFVVSPWSRGGFVCSQVFDHTSVIRLVEILTGVAEPNISRWRRQVSGDLTAAFDFTSTQVAMPALPDPENTATSPTCAATAGAASLQEAGTRPARALPYQPNAVATVNAEGSLRLALSNCGAESVHFAVYVEGEDAPRQCDVHGGDGSREIAVETSDGYDVHVHGPNGFARRCAGSRASRGIEAATDYVLDGSLRLRLILTNASASLATLRVSADGYAGDHPREFRLAPGEHRVVERDASATNAWYDVSITADVDPSFLRRCTGHMESGEASISG
jgi:phospholipase C